SLAAALVAAAQQAPFDAQVVGLNFGTDPKAWAPPTVDGLAAAMNVTSGSSAWGTIGGPALDGGPVAIVLVSDQQDDTDPAAIPALQSRLGASGVPVLCLPVGDVNEEITARIVAVSGGGRFDPNDPGTAGK